MAKNKKPELVEGTPSNLSNEPLPPVTEGADLSIEAGTLAVGVSETAVAGTTDPEPETSETEVAPSEGENTEMTEDAGLNALLTADTPVLCDGMNCQHLATYLVHRRDGDTRNCINHVGPASTYSYFEKL
jgi:hypothetical protein